MTGTPTPHEVFDRLLKTTQEEAWDELADLYAEDVTIEMPFAPPGVPTTSTGREELRARMKAFGGGRMPLKFESIDSVVVLETADPEVIVAQFVRHGHSDVTGEAFQFPYIMVITVRDGLIAASRDYSNPLAAMQALGRVPEFPKPAAAPSS